MLSYRKGLLHVEEVGAETLAERFGTPLYVYSQRALRERFWTLKTALRARKPLLCYAMKANPNRAVCRVLAGEGAGADIVSGGELARALAAGFAPERIVFSGVGKTEGEMAQALKAGILAFNLESRPEMQALERVSARLKRRAPISVRLNPDIDAKTHPHITTGRAENKFGVERAEALAMYRQAARSRHLRVRGIQCHIGSQIVGTRPYEMAARSIARVIAQLREEGIRLEMADFGGGLGIPYKDEPALDVEAFARTLVSTLAPWPSLRLLLEPGRYLAADAGILLTRVLYKKTTSKRNFVIVDAAMNDLARPALYGAYHPVWPARAAPKGEGEVVDIVGPICESADFLARRRRLPKSRPGDILAVLKAGAYGFAMSSQYNSRPRAAEVIVQGSSARLVRRRETIKDLVRGEL